MLCFVAFPLEGAVDVLIAVPFALLVVAVAVGPWRRATDGDERDRLGTADDITHDPYADPGQAARDGWERAIRRLPDGDGDDERD